MKKLLITLSFLLFLSFYLFSAENILKNGNFEQDNNNDNVPDFWSYSKAEGISLLKENENKFIYLINKNNEYKEINQTILIEPGSIKSILVKAKIKIKNIIPGPQEWEWARVMVLFYDTKGVQVGGWPELGRWKGTFDWSEKMNIINVPPEARSILVQVQLSNCTGEMWADDLQVLPDVEFNIPRDDDDLLINGDMEFGSSKPLYWGGWINGDASFESPGYKSPTCFKITNTSPVFSMIIQQIPIDTSKISSINVSGWYKIKDVEQGVNPWEKARISIEFHNETGRFGDWPPVVGEAVGTIDEWTYMEREYFVPKETKSIQVFAGLLNAKGTMWLDKIKVTAKDAKGKPVKYVEFKPEDRSNWYDFSPTQDTYDKKAIIDFTDELDKPAGKHGFIKISEKDKSLIFEDGTPAKFFGTNLVGGDVFLSHAEIDKMVKRLAKLGVNMVRLHHMDAPWAEPNIFGNSKQTTRILSEESLDKLDYLIYKLKEAGIYIFMDLLVHRKPGPEDGVEDWQKIPNGMKEVIFIDEKLQELTEEYIKNLLEHKNKYTGLKYTEEPAIVFMEVINESSLFYWDRNSEIPEKYTKKLNELFNKYLKEKYGSMDNLRKAWSAYGDSNLQENEDFNSNTVKRESFMINWEDWRAFGTAISTGRGVDTKRFYLYYQDKFYKRMYDFIKSLGVKALVTGSNHWEKWDADIYSNSKLDFIDRHSYWDHPSGGWTMQENISFTNAPILKMKNNCISELAHARVNNKPFTVSEWNFLLPNEYRTGSPIIMAAYGKLQGWDALLQFNFGTYEWKNLLTHFCDFSRSPDILSQWAPALKIFHNNYVSTSKQKIVEYVSEKDMFETKNLSFKLVNNDYNSPLMIKVAKTFNKTEESKNFNPVLKKDAALSITQELYWNLKKGVFQIDNLKIQGVIGFIKGQSFKFKNFRVLSDNKYASIFLYSLDNKPIMNSSKLILNVAARIDNKNTKYSPNHTSVIYGGSSPIIIEPVNATYTINVNVFKSIKVYTLDYNNYIKDEYKNYTIISKDTIRIKTDNNSKAFNYYIEVIR
ncbi:MAG: beta-galactosidase [Candidatus Goldbacteria bacterium]|nr:beta-galactosidase [Candidatus Goldiibacteriota bacterium]